MSTSNHVLRIAALLAVLSPAIARAQIWQGPASLEIKADAKKASVAGATVELLYLALEPPAGPPPVQLDSNGRAVVGGLAEGMWRVSVSREGFMTYQAEVDVRRDEKPELVATFQQNVPGAVHMMQVKIARAKPSGSSAPPPPPRIAERPAPRPAEPPPAPAPAPAPATPPQEQPAPTAPAPSQTPPKPVPQAPAPQEPAPQAPAPEAPPVERPAPAPVPPAPEPSAPAPAPAPAPTPAPPEPEPVPPSRVPPPPASAPPQAEPQPAPPPAPAAPPRGSILRRSYADRTCYECKPGEASLSAERVVSSGAGCGSGVRDLLAQSGDPAGLPDGCAVLRLILPPGARYKGYRYEIQERSGSVDCLAGRDCPGGGRWPADPALARSTAGTTVSAAFENPGAGGERRAILTIYYTEQ